MIDGDNFHDLYMNYHDICIDSLGHLLCIRLLRRQTFCGGLWGKIILVRETCLKNAKVPDVSIHIGVDHCMFIVDTMKVVESI